MSLYYRCILDQTHSFRCWLSGSIVRPNLADPLVYSWPLYTTVSSGRLESLVRAACISSGVPSISGQLPVGTGRWWTLDSKSHLQKIDRIQRGIECLCYLVSHKQEQTLPLTLTQWIHPFDLFSYPLGRSRWNPGYGKVCEGICDICKKVSRRLYYQRQGRTLRLYPDQEWKYLHPWPQCSYLDFEWTLRRP